MADKEPGQETTPIRLPEALVRDLAMETLVAISVGLEAYGPSSTIDAAVIRERWVRNMREEEGYEIEGWRYPSGVVVITERSMVSEYGRNIALPVGSQQENDTNHRQISCLVDGTSVLRLFYDRKTESTVLFPPIKNS